MNRKQRIVVSVVGITIVLLALLGITYAYYLTRIQGNTNINSISVTTADLELVYGDGNNNVITAENIMPGTDIGNKDFTVTSNSTKELEFGVYLEDIVNELERKQDMVYYLTCQKNDGSICSGIGSEESPIEYPGLSSQIVSDSILPHETFTYNLFIKYLNPDEDQSIDMNKTVKGKLQIYNLQDIVDIDGIVASYTEGDYIEIHSTPKTSAIITNKNGEHVYNLVGVEYGTHTLKLKSSGGQEKATMSLTIKKGGTTTLENNTITLSNDTKKVSVGLDSSNNFAVSSWRYTNNDTQITNGKQTLTLGDIVNYVPSYGWTWGINIYHQNVNPYHDFKLENIQQARNTKWRVLGIDECGRPLIMSSKDITGVNGEVSCLYINGVRNGFLNAINNMNSISELYGRGTGAVGARSVTESDIAKLVTNIASNDEDINLSGSALNGTTVTYTYKTDTSTDFTYYDKKLKSKITKTHANGFTYYDGNSWKKLSQNNPTTTITSTHKAYRIRKDYSNVINKNVYDMISGDDPNHTYFLATEFVYDKGIYGTSSNPKDKGAAWGILNMLPGSPDGVLPEGVWIWPNSIVYSPTAYETSDGYAVSGIRPVVILKTNISFGGNATSGWTIQ